jgi:pimeloyl-ACP methyl ester carboxylesterase
MLTVMKYIHYAILLLLCSCHVTRVHTSAKDPTGPKLAFVDEGGGTPIVLVHGEASDYRMFDSLREPVSKKFRFIAVSRRYHLPNPPPGNATAYTYEQQSEDIADFIKDLKAGAVHLVGHSWSGPAVLLTAIHHPDLVRSLILAEPNVGSLINNDPEASTEIKSRNGMIAQAKTLAGEGDDRAALEVMMNWVEGSADAFKQRPEKIRQMMFENASTIRPMLEAPPLKLSCKQLAQVKMPVLIIQGQNTRPYYRFIAKTVSGCIQNSQSAVVPQARHNMFLDNPAGSADLMLTFISKIK